MIKEDILEKYGATIREYNKSDFIFQEGEYAKYYFQVKSGELKMNNYTEDGKEFIQGMFSEGESFGEPPLLGDFKYPANAEALANCQVWTLNKDSLFNLLKENPQINLEVTKVLAKRLYYKALMAVEISNHQAGHRILTLLDFVKDRSKSEQTPFSYEVELTRKQIGDLTGLRTETVIRAMKELELQNEIRIENRKVFR